MKVVILAGGFGTRISEESAFKPKPMIEIGGMPILWHIMKTYAAYGFNEFVICAGYKQHVIKEWFADYFLHTSDITFDYTNGSNEMLVHNKHAAHVKAAMHACAEKVNGRRGLFMPGCELPNATPTENVKAIAEALKEIG